MTDMNLPGFSWPELKFENDAEAIALALSLKVRCQFGHTDCPNTPVCDCPVLSTPPVENSKPVGGPSGADGQGACTRLYMLTYSDPATDGRVAVDCDLVPVNAAMLLRSLLARGVESVVVEVQA